MISFCLHTFCFPFISDNWFNCFDLDDNTGGIVDIFAIIDYAKRINETASRYI